VRVLFLISFFFWEGVRFYVVLRETYHVWSRDGRVVADCPDRTYGLVRQSSLGTVTVRFSEDSLGRVFVCVSLVEDVVCAIYECHRLGSMGGDEG
jgi:hypothetical protein